MTIATEVAYGIALCDLRIPIPLASRMRTLATCARPYCLRSRGDKTRVVSGCLVPPLYGVGRFAPIQLHST